MTNFIKQLEEKFDTQIIRSNTHVRAENYYDVDEDGNIKTLYLDEIDLKDLGVLLPIADSLVKLAVVDCNIESVRPLKSFSKLETLDLGGNPLHESTLQYLSDVKNLKNLDLSGTDLKDTSSLGSLTNLEMLFIGGSDRLYEVKGLEDLKSLYHLDASFSCIKSIENICANENIRVLNLGNVDIEKVTHLERFPGLENLNLNSTFVERMEGFDASKNLKKLFISTWRIKRIEGLENLSKLEVLDLNLNEISKIEGLDHLTNLKWLSLNENQISKVENLDNLINLELLLLEANKPITYFDTMFFNNLVSDCYIYMRGEKDIQRIQAVAPENVKINYDDDYRWPTSLYRGPRGIFE